MPVDPGEIALWRIGGVAAVVGGLLGVIGTILHPQPEIGDIGKAQPYVDEILHHGGWVTAHLLLIVGVTLFLVGFVALASSMRGIAGAIARVALVLAILDTIIHVITLGIDGVVMHQAAATYQAAPAGAETSALQSFTALFDLLFGLFTVWEILWGLTFLSFGVAVWLSATYPRWLGAVAAAAGVALVSVGAIDSYRGVSRETFTIAFPALAATVSIWVMVMGVLLLLRARVGDARPRPA